MESGDPLVEFCKVYINYKLVNWKSRIDETFRGNQFKWLIDFFGAVRPMEHVIYFSQNYQLSLQYLKYETKMQG